MQNKNLLIVIIVVLVLGGVYAFTSLKPNAEAPSEVNTDGVSNTMPVPGAEGVNEMVVSQETKTYIVEGDNFSFIPNVMNVKKGDRVKITFKNKEGFHDLKIDEFGVATPQIKAGEEATVEFVADKVGSFDYYCSVGSHRQMGMVGKLTITE